MHFWIEGTDEHLLCISERFLANQKELPLTDDAQVIIQLWDLLSSRLVLVVGFRASGLPEQLGITSFLLLATLLKLLGKCV